MKTRTIKIEAGVKYLSQSKNITELPANCLFDKGKVGCGGTTLAIESGVPYVIAVPFVSLIENKVAQHPNMLGVYEGVKAADIKKYIKNTENPIIMTTYDSLSKIGKYIDTAKYKLLVDEYHLLFTQYSFRDEAINNVLKEYKNYKEYCFMTATPLEEEFILEELKDLELVSTEWADTTEVTVKSIKCINGVNNTVVDLVNDFLSGKEEGNLYLFVNSVNFIKEIVANTNLTIDNCNVIYSKNNKTDVGIDRGTLPSHKSGSIQPKKINLLTSTVFEGTDIYDENGRTYIVSDASRTHTLTDISTSFQQIAGRIRNSKYMTTIHHLFTHTRYTELSYDEFKNLSLKEVEIAKKASNSFNQLPEEQKQYLISAGLGKINETYITVKGNDISFNPNLVKLDIYNYKVSKHLYKLRVNLKNECDKYGFRVETYNCTTETRISPTELEGFETVVKTLQSFGTQLTEEQAVYTEAAYVRFPFLKEAIEKLGFEGIEKEGYVQTNIKRKITSLLNVNDETKIYKLLIDFNDVKSGEFISATTLKSRFKTIYDSLSLSKTPKGSDINMYFNTKPTKKKVNGKTVEGYLLLNSKTIIK